jgi:hypothetical protein
MRLFNGFIGALTLAACVMIGSPALAAPVVITGPGLTYPVNMNLVALVTGDLATPYTNATTTPSIVTGMTVTLPATVRPYQLQTICVRWSADATKATSTTGSIGIGFNTVVDATSYRFTSSAAGRNSINGSTCFARPSAAAIVVSLYGVSGDTAALTVNNAFMEVWNVVTS